MAVFCHLSFIFFLWSLPLGESQHAVFDDKNWKQPLSFPQNTYRWPCAGFLKAGSGLEREGGDFTTKDIEDRYCCGVFWVAIILLQMELLKIVLFWDSSVHSPHVWWVGCFLRLTIMISHQKNRIWWILCWSHDDAWSNSMEFSSLLHWIPVVLLCTSHPHGCTP